MIAAQNVTTTETMLHMASIGVGGLTALVQVVMAAMIAPRERGRYSGYLGATFALATISGPLLGGLIVDTSWLGWRWCFFVGAPFALLAFIVLQKTLHLPVVRLEGVSIDYLGATLIVGGVSTLLIWVSLAGHQFAWGSPATALTASLPALCAVARLLRCCSSCSRCCSWAFHCWAS